MNKKHGIIIIFLFVLLAAGLSLFVCSKDDSSSSPPECGNNVVEADEVCDGTDLDGQTCTDEGFDGGSLECNADCNGYVTTNCITAIPPNPPINTGEIIFTEVMPDPTGTEPDNEWFEVYNTTGTTIDLEDCVFSQDPNGTQTITIVGSLPVNAGSYIVLAGSPNPSGITPDYSYTQFQISQSSATESLVLTCGGQEIDRVDFENNATWPHDSGISASLDPGSYSYTDNDLAANWCEGVAEYSINNFGSPGSANPTCP